MPGGKMANGAAQPDTFHIGLTMAGAISAGAYTAGVMDFLFEALAAFEEVRGKTVDGRTYPGHRVVISAISGASAGGMCSALLLPALIEGLSPYSDEKGDRLVKQVVSAEQVPSGKIRPVLPRFYDSWVEGPDFTSGLGGNSFFGSRDLDEDAAGPLRSILNTTLLDEISMAALALPADAKLKPHPYISDPLHVYLSTSNLRGMPYQIPFEGNYVAGYGMLDHGERQHLVFNGLGSYGHASPWAAADSGVQIQAASLIGADLKDKTGVWTQFIACALATGAFPAAFIARKLSRTLADWTKRRWPSTEIDAAAIKPYVQGDAQQSIDYLNVDGGCIDNEPFEYARWAIMAEIGKGNPRQDGTPAGAIVDRAVLMIDPFPEAPAFDVTAALDERLTSLPGNLLSMFINQCRFKPGDVALAMMEDVYSRFLIVPSGSNDAALGEQAIACGALGGFGGFLYKPFRQHDFLLGRRNCQQFLRNALALPKNYGFIQKNWGALADKPEFQTKDEKTVKDAPGGTPYCPILPLTPAMDDDCVKPLWPRMPGSDLERISNRLGDRLDAVKDRLTKQTGLAWYVRLVLWAAWKVKLKSMILEKARYSILTNLLLRDQISGYGNETNPLASIVLAALADPDYDVRTADGIVVQYQTTLVKSATSAAGLYADTPAAISAVAALLAAGGSSISKGPKIDDKQTYALKERAPNFLYTTPILGGIANSMSSLSLDFKVKGAA
jgi:hypothetical protein